MRVFQQACEVREGARIAHPPQGRRRRLTHPAVRILQGGRQGDHRLVVLDLLKSFDRGATHLGILVAKARQQQFERARVPGGVQAFEGFAAHFGAA